MTQITNLRSREAEEAEAGAAASFNLDVVEFTLPSSYQNPGGTPGAAAALGYRAGSLEALIPINHLGYFWEYNPVTDSIKVYQQPAAAAAGASPEVPNTTNLSGAGTVRAVAFVKQGQV